MVSTTKTSQNGLHLPFSEIDFVAAKKTACETLIYQIYQSLKFHQS